MCLYQSSGVSKPCHHAECRIVEVIVTRNHHLFTSTHHKEERGLSQFMTDEKAVHSMFGQEAKEKLGQSAKTISGR